MRIFLTGATSLIGAAVAPALVKAGHHVTAILRPTGPVPARLRTQGIDVLTMHVDSPKVIVELAERRGAFVTGYHANQATLAPKGYLTGAEWNWGKVYTDYVSWVQAGKTYPHLLRGGLKDGFVKVSPYGKAVSAAAKKKADAAKAKFMDGTMVVYKGPLKDNTGKVVIAAGAEQKQTDVALEKMDYLVEGVVGKTR